MKRNVCFLPPQRIFTKKTANNLSHQKAAKMSQESTKEAAKPRRVQLQARSSTEEKKSFRYLKKNELRGGEILDF